MGWLRKSTDVAGRSDAVASWGERAGKVLLLIFGPSAVSAVVLGGLGWLASNPLYGALIGLAAFALTQVGLTLLAIRRSASNRGPFAEPAPVPAGGDTSHGVTTQTLSIAEVLEEVENENEQLEAKLRKVGQEREQLQADKDALIEELEQARANTVEVLPPTITQEDSASVIQSRNAEIEELRRQIAALLRQDCREMADYLKWFLADHKDRPENEIVDLYHERYQDKVSDLLLELRPQGLYPPEHRKSYQIDADKFPRSPTAIGHLGRTLGSIGQEI